MDSLTKRLHNRYVKPPPLFDVVPKNKPTDKCEKDFALVLQERQKKALWLKKIRMENDAKSDYVRYSLEHLLKRRYEHVSATKNDESVLWERDVLQKGMQAAADNGLSFFLLNIEGPHHEKTWHTVKEPDLFGRAAAFLLQHVFYSNEMRVRWMEEVVDTKDIVLEISWRIFGDDFELEDSNHFELPPLPFVEEVVHNENIEKQNLEKWNSRPCFRHEFIEPKPPLEIKTEWKPVFEIMTDEKNNNNNNHPSFENNQNMQSMQSTHFRPLLQNNAKPFSRIFAPPSSREHEPDNENEDDISQF